MKDIVDILQEWIDRAGYRNVDPMKVPVDIEGRFPVVQHQIPKTTAPGMVGDDNPEAHAGESFYQIRPDHPGAARYQYATAHSLVSFNLQIGGKTGIGGGPAVPTCPLLIPRHGTGQAI